MAKTNFGVRLTHVRPQNRDHGAVDCDIRNWVEYVRTRVNENDFQKMAKTNVDIRLLRLHQENPNFDVADCDVLKRSAFEKSRVKETHPK